MKKWYLYTTVRFMPYRASEEFANIGIVVCPTDEYWIKYRLLAKMNDRTKAFFPYLEDHIFDSNVKYFSDTMAFNCEQINNFKSDNLAVFCSEGIIDIDNSSKEKRDRLAAIFFKEMIRPKEGIIVLRSYYSSILSEDINKTLDELFLEYVDHKKEFIYEHKERE